MKLKCYPVCECGYVFRDLWSNTTLEKVTEDHYREVRKFYPSECPMCNNKIESIKLPKEGYGGGISFKE